MKKSVLKRKKKTCTEKHTKNPSSHSAIFTTSTVFKAAQRMALTSISSSRCILSSLFKFSYLLLLHTTLNLFLNWSLQPKAGSRWHIQARIFCVDVLFLQLMIFRRGNFQRVVGEQTKLLHIPILTQHVDIKILESCRKVFYLSSYINI